MAFAEITKDYAPQKKEVIISYNGNEYKFHAVEISYLANQSVAIQRAAGGNWLLDFLVASIVDEQGKHMTVQQAEALSGEHADAFLAAALEVNKGQAEKN